MRLLDWRRLLVYTHRWLGIAGCILFITWFISGVVMMYARMPSLTLDERLARRSPLDLASATISPEAVARRERIAHNELRVGMLDGRPVYHFVDGRALVTVFADNGERLAGLTDREAVAVVRAFMPEHGATVRHDARLADADQWTMGVRGLMPMHRIEVGDPDASVV